MRLPLETERLEKLGYRSAGTNKYLGNEHAFYELTAQVRR
jgi:hypothetical protein